MATSQAIVTTEYATITTSKGDFQGSTFIEQQPLTQLTTQSTLTEEIFQNDHQTTVLSANRTFESEDSCEGSVDRQ